MAPLGRLLQGFLPPVAAGSLPAGASGTALFALPVDDSVVPGTL